MICNNQISQVRKRGRGHCEVPSPLQSVSIPCTDQLRHDQTGGTLLTRIKLPEICVLRVFHVPAEPAPPGQGEESDMKSQGYVHRREVLRAEESLRLFTCRVHGSTSTVGEVKDDLFVRSDVYQRYKERESLV